ncbi:MAG: hypothetical protein LJF15_16125 [Acidobacteria bacterium]|jgi:hypothetical protein|nr:hypothetical protein [Acidobacteriota bacterium]
MPRSGGRPILAGPLSPARRGVVTELVVLLRERGDALVAEALTMMTEARLEHYDAAGLPTVRQRLATLLEVVLSCLESGEADEIVTYMTRVGRERFSAGYDLLEVQTSANVMEETLWRRIPSLVDPAEVPRALGLVSSLFSAAKDALARTYVSLAASATARPGKDAGGGGDDTPGE